MGKKHHGKRRKYCLLALSPFPTMFSKASFLWVILESRLCGIELLFTTQSQLLMTLRKEAFENIVGKGEITDKCDSSSKT